MVSWRGLEILLFTEEEEWQAATRQVPTADDIVVVTFSRENLPPAGRFDEESVSTWEGEPDTTMWFEI